MIHRGLRLVPILDVYDSILSGEGGGPFREPRWDAFYRGRVVDAGLPPPIDAHPWLVRAADLRAGAGLVRLVRATLRDGDEDGPALADRLRDPLSRGDALDEVPEMAGGYALESNNRWLALPGCCAGLGSLGDWQEATRHGGTDRAMLWTGHPWLYVSADGDVLTLTGPTEQDAGPEIARVGRRALLDAVIAAAAERARFGDRLRTVCARMTGADAAAEVADRLIGIG